MPLANVHHSTGNEDQSHGYVSVLQMVALEALLIYSAQGNTTQTSCALLGRSDCHLQCRPCVSDAGWFNFGHTAGPVGAA